MLPASVVTPSADVDSFAASVITSAAFSVCFCVCLTVSPTVVSSFWAVDLAVASVFFSVCFCICLTVSLIVVSSFLDIDLLPQPANAANDNVAIIPAATMLF